MAKRGPKSVGFKPKVWSAGLAYSVGLFAADGSLSKDGRHIDFTSEDLVLAEIFRTNMYVNTPISYKTDGGKMNKKYARVQFSNVNLYHWLEDIGFTPNKSKTIKDISVPDEFFHHFLRGYFDGDGSIYSFWDTRWHSSYMFYITFACSSKDFLILRLKETK